MLRLHANVYALPAAAVDGPVRTLRGLELPTLVGPAGGPPPYHEVLPVSFEAVQQRLGELPSCDHEPDGFFLVTGRTDDGLFWRLNGHMHEHQPDGADAPWMHRVELNGECPAADFDRVLASLGWPEARLAFELVREGVSLREDDLRRYAVAE